MNDSERVKSKAMIDSSASDSLSDSEFQNVAKKPKLDLPRVRIQSIEYFLINFLVEVCLILAGQIILLQQLLWVR